MACLINNEHRFSHVDNLSIAKAFLTCENTWQNIYGTNRDFIGGGFFVIML